MVDEIPLKPHEQLAYGKLRTLRQQLATDFPHAPGHVTEQAVHQASALLWPGMNLEALFASAAMLVRSSAK